MTGHMGRFFRNHFSGCRVKCGKVVLRSREKAPLECSTTTPETGKRSLRLASQ